MLKRTLRFLAVVFPVAGVVGCYSYQRIDPAIAPVGTEVRATITGAATDRVAPLIGSFDSRVLVGSVVENRAGAMTLEVPTGAMPNVAENIVRLHARVPIVPTDLVGLEQRKLDVGRTWLLAGAVGAGVAPQPIHSPASFRRSRRRSTAFPFCGCTSSRRGGQWVIA